MRLAALNAAGDVGKEHHCQSLVGAAQSALRGHRGREPTTRKAKRHAADSSPNCRSSYRPPPMSLSTSAPAASKHSSCSSDATKALAASALLARLPCVTHRSNYVAKSLSQIQSQIQKLQKEVDAVRSAAIARIRKEMAQHGLTAEDLFGEARSTFIGNGRATKGKAKADRPPKYADGSGNTWGGMGKRPAWIREALEAGRSLEEFLVGAAPKAAKPAKAAKPGRKTAAPAAAPKKAAAKRPARKKATAPAAAAPEES